MSKVPEFLTVKIVKNQNGSLRVTIPCEYNSFIGDATHAELSPTEDNSGIYVKFIPEVTLKQEETS